MTAMSMYFPQGFALDTAVVCADLVNCAYDQYSQWYAADYPDMSSFAWTPSLSGYLYSHVLYWEYDWMEVSYQEPVGFVAWADEIAYVVFRGTMSDTDALYDAKVDQVAYAQASGFGYVHLGYSEIYAQLSPQVLHALGDFAVYKDIDQIVFTGHSMGSGLSTLAVPDIVENGGYSCGFLHINLASPRVGDPTFASATNALSLSTFRVVNTEDIVPDGPLAIDGGDYYQHVGTPIDFTANYLSIDGNHSLTGAYIYALANPDSPQDMTATSTSLDRSGGPKPIGAARDGHVGPAAIAAALRTKARGPVPGDAAIGTE